MTEAEIAVRSGSYSYQHGVMLVSTKTAEELALEPDD